MAKSKGTAPKSKPDPFDLGLKALLKGDYPTSRAHFAAAIKDENLTESHKETAQDLTAATQVDKITLYVGVACIGLFLLAVTLVGSIQP